MEENEEYYLYTQSFTHSLFSEAEIVYREKINNYIKYGKLVNNQAMNTIMLATPNVQYVGVDVKSISTAVVFANNQYTISVSLVCCAKKGQYQDHGQTAIATELITN